MSSSLQKRERRTMKEDSDYIRRPSLPKGRDGQSDWQRPQAAANHSGWTLLPTSTVRMYIPYILAARQLVALLTGVYVTYPSLQYKMVSSFPSSFLKLK